MIKYIFLTCFILAACGESKPEKPFWENPNMSYEDALREARKEYKPLLVYFTGYSVMSVRTMEDKIFTDAAVEEMMQEHFVCVSFFVDDKTPLPESEQFTSTVTGKLVKTIGTKHSNFQIEKFNTNSQPFFAILDRYENVIATSGYEPDKEKFMEFLKKGL